MDITPAMNDIINMTPEQQKEFNRKTKKRIVLFVGIKVASTVIAVVAGHALSRHLEKKFAEDNRNETEEN